MEQKTNFSPKGAGEARIVFRTPNQMIKCLLLRDNAILRISTKRPKFEVNYIWLFANVWKVAEIVLPFDHFHTSSEVKRFACFGSIKAFNFARTST